MTGTQLAQAALEKIGAYSTSDGDLPAADLDVALRHAELWRKSASGQSLALSAIERQSFTWTAGQASRTLGPTGAQLTGTKPLMVLAAKVIPAGATYEQTVDLMTHGQYAAIGNKAQTAEYFWRLLWEPTGRVLGTLTVWPVPSAAPTLLLHNRVRLTAITDATDIEISEEAELAFVLAVAKANASTFGKAWTRELEDERREAWAVYQRANMRIPDERCMPAGFPGGGRGRVSQSDYDAGNF